MHRNLHSAYDLGLRNRLEAEPECKVMVMSKYCCAMKLLGLVKKTCNGSTFVVVDDVVSNLLEAMHNLLLTRRDDFPAL